jgi:hypothetical protein
VGQILLFENHRFEERNRRPMDWSLQTALKCGQVVTSRHETRMYGLEVEQLTTPSSAQLLLFYVNCYFVPWLGDFYDATFGHSTSNGLISSGRSCLVRVLVRSPFFPVNDDRTCKIVRL